MADNINSPVHYNSLGAKCAQCEHPIECIDVAEKANFCIGNVWKYTWRYQQKNGLEDLRKAQWYLAREIARLEKEEKRDSQ